MNIGYSMIITALILVVIGIYIMVSKRNLVRILIGLEIIATGVNINFIAMSLLKSQVLLLDPLPHAIVITSILLDGALVGVGLALTLVVFRKYRTLDVDYFRRLRW